jgi:hypothetical protein
MKKFMLTLVALITMTVQASAMSYEQARDQALFLTDKMAYELNLTDDQYEAAYEINLDYLMGINSRSDLFGNYWTQRNLDLSYILLDWQYRAFVDAAYFYRPLYWDAGFWHFRIYARYPHRDYFFFGRPAFYASYRGGHSWRMNGGASWYHGRSWGGPSPDGARRTGMRDGFDRGDFGRGKQLADNHGTRQFGNGTRFANNQTANSQRNSQRTFGGNRRNTQTTNGTTRTFGGATRQSSTRTTVTQPGNSQRTFGRGNTSTTKPSNTFTPSTSQRQSTATRTFGGSSSNSSVRQSAPTRSFSAPSRTGGTSRSFGGGNNSGASRSTGGHFGRK